MRFIIKHSQSINPQKRVIKSKVDLKKNESTNEVTKKEENNKEKSKAMDKISVVEDIINEVPKREIKRLKKDKGLIERTESSKTILTEDNKQLLVD